ncbi:hypothetical protein QBC46DRAFT_144896 [Diplogelasinospora grovesii]|uniref:Uncharacterized protein n=1 Tax=Diplogelasinospora grovesii TaxID=303347 RepID=A0AAN6N861_9PEZI|nr:hypothetical protein QBC46DRAFT_144896 [Diplogelasinospora grovesii]
MVHAHSSHGFIHMPNRFATARLGGVSRRQSHGAVPFQQGLYFHIYTTGKSLKEIGKYLPLFFCGCSSFVFLVGGLMRLKIRAFAGVFHALFHGQKGGSLLGCCFCFHCFTCCVFSSPGCNYRLITPLIVLMVDTSQECGWASQACSWHFFSLFHSVVG